VRILHVIPSFYPAYIYGGPIESTYQLCCHLALNGCNVRVLTTDANGPDKVLDVEKDREVKINDEFYVRYCKRLMPDSVSYRLLRVLLHFIHWADIVHLTAVYSFPTIPTLITCKILGKPVIWSPRGAFKRWQGSTRVQIKALWEWVCRSAAPKSLVLHVTSEEEARESLKRFPRLETFIIPNGVAIPDQVRHHNNNGILRLLYLGRLHPIKGIENLLEAGKILSSDHELVWSLTIAGSGDPDYTESIRMKIKELALSQNVKMVGEVRGEDKQFLFENTDVVVVPSHTENFGMVVAEALSHEIPVIASKGTPWSRIEEVGCGLWVDNNYKSLAEAIKQISQMSLQKMGQQGRAWMVRDFAWDTIAKKMITLYQSFIKPPFNQPN